MAKMWIEYDESCMPEGWAIGGAARWGSVTEEQLDAVLAFAETLCGKPDTTR